MDTNVEIENKKPIISMIVSILGLIIFVFFYDTIKILSEAYLSYTSDIYENNTGFAIRNGIDTLWLLVGGVLLILGFVKQTNIGHKFLLVGLYLFCFKYFVDLLIIYRYSGLSINDLYNFRNLSVVLAKFIEFISFIFIALYYSTKGKFPGGFRLKNYLCVLFIICEILSIVLGYVVFPYLYRDFFYISNVIALLLYSPFKKNNTL